MTDEVWILGATGRIGRGVTERLQQAGVEVVVAGRSAERLATAFPTARAVTGSLDEICGHLATQKPAVVVNTVGPFTTTAPAVARAGPPGTHYLDVANDLHAFAALDAMDHDAVATGRAIVPGSGFGVLATEAVLLHLLTGEQTPARVRVDAIASVAGEPGRLGDALAATIVDSLRDGGREVRGGEVVRAWAGGERERLTTPDGDLVTTASVGGGDLFAAWRATHAPTVIAASALAPTSPLARVGLGLVGGVLRLPGLAGLATWQLARVTTTTHRERPRASSWARARVEWPSGLVREGWLGTGEAMVFTIDATAEIARRLLRGEGRPGTRTPARLFGPDLALAAGARFVDATPHD